MTYDHEVKSSYSVTVKADDNNGGTATIDVTITVADVNEPPEFSVETASRTIAENTTTGVAIGAPVTATDPDTGDTLTQADQVQAGANRPPEFDSATATREVPENTEAGGNIGAPVTATDPDTGDTPRPSPATQ